MLKNLQVKYDTWDLLQNNMGEGASDEAGWVVSWYVLTMGHVCRCWFLIPFCLLQYIFESSLIKTFLKISHLAFSSPNTSSHLKYRFSAAKLVIIHTRLNQKLNSMQISTYFISKYLKSLLKIPFTRFDAPSKKQTTTKPSLRGDCVPGGIPRAVCTAHLALPGVITGNATTPVLHVRNGVRDGINNVLRDTWSEVWMEPDVLRIRLEFLGHKCGCPVRYSRRGRLRKVSEWAPSSWSLLLPSCAATRQTLACTHQPRPLAEHPPCVWVCQAMQKLLSRHVPAFTLPKQLDGLDMTPLPI